MNTDNSSLGFRQLGSGPAGRRIERPLAALGPRLLVLDRGHFDQRHLRADQRLAALRSAGGALVDLTPSWGYYCRRLEDIGFPSTALASNGESDEFLHALRVTQAATFATARAHDAAAHPAFAVGVALDPAYLGLGAERRLLDLLSTVALDELVLAVPAASAEAWDLAAVARAGHFTTRVELPAPAGATRLHHFVR